MTIGEGVTTQSDPNPPVAPAYTRILLKLSGEALMGDDAFGINRDDGRPDRARR